MTHDPRQPIPCPDCYGPHPEQCPEHSDAALARQNLNRPRDLISGSWRARAELAQRLAEDLIDHATRDLSAWGTSLADAQRSQLVGTFRQKILEALNPNRGAVRKPPVEGGG